MLQIQVQQIKEPGRRRTDRANDDRAAAGRRVRGHHQRPRPGAVEERQPGKVQDKPLGTIIHGPGHVLQELSSRGEVQGAAQG